MPAGGLSDEIRELLEDEQDVEYEQEISRNPYSLKAWWRYIQAKQGAKRVKRYIIYERALKYLPRSYKLWHAYLNERKKAVEGKVEVTHKKYQILVNTYERALVHLSKMPRIWLDLCQVLVDLKKGTLARRTFDRALQALPITQHHRVWELYLPWAKALGVKDTAIRVYRRFLKYNSTYREEYVDYLEEQGEFEEAAQQLALCVNDDSFISPKGTSQHAMWMRLCDMCAKHPEEVSRRLKVDAIIRSGLSRFSDEVGRLWTKLADYYIRLGQFEKARDIYEEGINSVLTVRDFTLIFDAYARFEESVLSARIEMLEEKKEEDDDDDEEDKVAEDLDIEGDDTELRLARLEDLMERRPVLLSSVLLRQNPHNVHEWHKRTKLFKDDPRKVIICYTEAVKTVDPKKAVGKPHTLWLSFAKLYEDHDELEQARQILDKATAANFRQVDDLAAIYCAWAEMEMRHECYDEALKVMQHAVAEPPAAVQRRRQAEAFARQKQGAQPPPVDIPVQERLHRSTKVWALYLDLEESLGTVETAKAAYERAIELKVITPAMLLNFCTFLEENKYYEAAFSVYEKGVALFGYPHVKPIWLRYLDNFVKRYGGSKLERARDLFEQCLEKVPAKDAPEIFIRYAKLEEEFGLARHAMAIYDRATKKVEDDRRFDMYLLYVKKVESLYGVTKTREIFERAIEELPDDMARKMCLEYAEVERKLGEIDRARAIFIHGSNFADPRRDSQYWKKWNDFEIAHGNEDTFKEMLRVKRTVQTAFSQVNYMAAEMLTGEKITSDAEVAAREAAKSVPASGTVTGFKRKAPESNAIDSDLAEVDRQRKKIQAVTGGAEESKQGGGRGANPEEISLDDEEEGAGGAGGPAGMDTEEDDGRNYEVKEKAIPDAVFARAGLGDSADEGGKEMGALERLRAAKKS